MIKNPFGKRQNAGSTKHDKDPTPDPSDLRYAILRYLFCAMLGGFVVGIAGELATAFLAWLGRPTVVGLGNATAYAPIVAFLIMILVLLVRPSGLVGGKTATAAITRRRFRLAFLARRET